MGWKISPPVAAILESGGEGGGIDRSQALMLMAQPIHSRETYALMETANRLSRELFGEKGENHFHIGVEPVGPEHSHEEIVDLMLLARRQGATYSGIMRRINFPGSPMRKFGMISELEMAKMVAVSRLVMGSIPKAHCTHEPHSASLMAGANLFFPEVGASPRDGEADTGKGRGRSVAHCHTLQKEMHWNPQLRSNCFD